MARSKPILAIVVLYKMRFSASPSYGKLNAAFREWPELASKIDLLVVDNSPEAQALPADFCGRYVHDGTNPGLASRYNYALREAVASGATWLLLLDQDTTLTDAYLQELAELSTQLAGEETIAIVVPKLIDVNTLQSPHLPRYRRSEYALDLQSYGVLGGLVRAYNSGAMLRVSALQAVGGFPEAYWLDYLDHATMHLLQARGGQVYVMQARLQHEMSIHRADKHEDPAHAARHRNQLRAEIRFYRQFGSVRERLWHRASLAKQALRSARDGFPAEAMRLMRAAVAVGTGKE